MSSFSGKNHRRFYQRRIDYNGHHDRNILCTKGKKLTKASLCAMDIIKLAAGIVVGVLVKDYAVYKKWINE